MSKLTTTQRMYAQKVAQKAMAQQPPMPPGMLLNPNQPSHADQMRAMAAKFVMEIASSIYVRITSDKLGDPFRNPDSEINNPETLAAIARDAFIAARLFLQVANEPLDQDQQKREQKAAGPKDPNTSPLVQP